MIYGWSRREIAELASGTLRAHELLRERALCASVSRRNANGVCGSYFSSSFAFVSFRLRRRSYRARELRYLICAEIIVVTASVSELQRINGKQAGYYEVADGWLVELFSPLSRRRMRGREL